MVSDLYNEFFGYYGYQSDHIFAGEGLYIFVCPFMCNYVSQKDKCVESLRAE
jgi:hypothetical protein